LSSIALNTSGKRRRITDFHIDDVDNDDEPGGREFKITSHIGKSSVGSSLKLQMQVDELKLTNEQLREQLKSFKSEHEVFKDQSARQLKFLEDLNHRYKENAETSKDGFSSRLNGPINVEKIISLRTCNDEVTA
jgi:FtsZ-binding cell division protein ZapB